MAEIRPPTTLTVHPLQQHFNFHLALSVALLCQRDRETHGDTAEDALSAATVCGKRRSSSTLSTRSARTYRVAEPWSESCEGHLGNACSMYMG